MACFRLLHDDDDDDDIITAEVGYSNSIHIQTNTTTH